MDSYTNVRTTEEEQKDTVAINKTEQRQRAWRLEKAK